MSFLCRYGFFILLAVTAASSLAGCSGGTSDSVQLVAVVGGEAFNLELSLNRAARIRGLSGRTALAVDAGMLFVFPDKMSRSFHMIDCYVPIDVVFIADDQTIVNYFTMPVEEDPANPKWTYRSDRPVRYVLELPGGTLARLGVKPGDSISLPLADIPEGAIR